MRTSDYRKRAEDWRELAEHLPRDQRPAAVEIAETWLRFAADAARLESSTNTIH